MGDASKVFDGPIKLLIQGSGAPFQQLLLAPVVEWLNVDLPRTQNRQVDLLGRMSDGRLLHIELQSSNDRTMPFRMAEYALSIMRRYDEYPVQLLIYVGNQRMRMAPEFRTEGMLCRYRQVDIRDLDAAALLASDRIEDNILAVLAGLQDSEEGVRLILRSIRRLRNPLREEALQQFLLTCGLRGLQKVCERELKSMPRTFDWSKSEWFQSQVERELSKAVRKAKKEAQKVGQREGWQEGLREGQQKGRRVGLQEGKQVGLQEGRQVGLQEGRQEGLREVVRLQLEKRFGRLPASIGKRLAGMTEAQTQELAVAIIDAKSLKELFGTTRRRA